MVSDETSLLAADSACSLCPHMVQREGNLSGVSCHEDGNSCGSGPLMTSFNLKYFLRCSILKHNQPGGYDFTYAFLGAGMGAYIQFRGCSPVLPFPLRLAVPSPEVPFVGRLFHGALWHLHCTAETSEFQGQGRCSALEKILPPLLVTSPSGLRTHCLCTRYTNVHFNKGELVDRDRYQDLCLIVCPSLISLSFWVSSPAHDCIKGWWGER